MAIKLSDQYPGRSDAPSIDYPNGSFKNRSAPGVLDGTPLDKVWANDKEGFFQGILAAAEIEADGLPDKVGDSQYLEALIKVIKDTPPNQATESVIGGSKIATLAKVQSGADDMDFVTSKKIKDAGIWPIGFSQNYYDETATFTKNTVYTNNYGRTIAIFLSTIDNGGGVNELFIDGKKAGEQNQGGSTSVSGQMFGLVTNGKTYEWRGGAAQALVSCIVIR